MHLISSHVKELLERTEAKLQNCAKLASVTSNLFITKLNGYHCLILLK